MVQKTTRDTDWADLDLNFGVNPGSNDISRLIGANAINRSIRNLVLMHFYDKPFFPQIGSNATKILFDNFGPLTAINLRTLIREVIDNFEPRANVLEVVVEADPEQNGYEAVIVYSIRNQNQPIVATIFLERLR